MFIFLSSCVSLYTGVASYVNETKSGRDFVKRNKNFPTILLLVEAHFDREMELKWSVMGLSWFYDESREEMCTGVEFKLTVDLSDLTKNYGKLRKNVHWDDIQKDRWSSCLL